VTTALCALTGVRYPIVQTGMGWVASASLVAATANAGGLGIIASATMDLGQLADAIAKTNEPHRPPVRRQPAFGRTGRDGGVPS
jgi:NAD(P)H-dependent flavin oxidoreductase YrpB (nitropropane dioxygenase family)